MHLTLINNKGFSWFTNQKVSFKGYFFDKNNVYYEKEKAIDYLSTITSKELFLSTIKSITGCFTIIINHQKTHFITTDTSRIFPLFYLQKNNELYISDSISHLKEQHNVNHFNEIAVTELKSALYTIGNKTLLKDIKQIQSDEYLIIKNHQIIENDFYYSYAIDTISKDSYNDLKTKAITIFDRVAQKLIKSLNNKTAVIPLSGGFDSRLIATFFKKHNYKNVICFTYGRANSFEIENSKRVAKELGFKWFFIEYKEELYKNFNFTKIFKSYAHYAGKYSSMPYLQEYFAVKHLHENKIIPKDAVFIPGFTGDFLGGSQFLKIIPKNLKTNQISDLILKSRFSFFPINKTQKTFIKKEIHQLLEHKSYRNKIPYSIYEDFNLKERMAKYIFNSANFYTFFGYEHRFPFWDKELLSFFKTVPSTYKIGKSFYNEVLIETYFKPFNVSFKNELEPSKNLIKIQKIKDKIRPYLPSKFKEKLLIKNDWDNYEAFTNYLKGDILNNKLTLKRRYKTYNEILVQWYIYYCKNKL